MITFYEVFMGEDYIQYKTRGEYHYIEYPENIYEIAGLNAVYYRSSTSISINQPLLF